MPICSAVMILLGLMSFQKSFAAPLGTIPRLETQDWYLIADLRSDLWTSPYSYKQSPVRIVGGELRIPIAHGEGWNISANVATESLSLSKTEFSLADREVFIGNNLQNQAFGMGFSRFWEDGSGFTLVGAYASASDNPFADDRDKWIEGTVTYRTGAFGNHRYIFAVNQSNNRGLANGKPFPFFGIILEPHPNLIAQVGFPFIRVIWKDVGKWKREAQVTPFGAYFDLERYMDDDFLLHAHTEYTIRSYLYDSRIDDANRLYYQEMTMDVALKKELSKATIVSFGIGYAFDRRLYEAQSIYEPRHDKSQMDSDIYGRLRMEFNL